MEGGVLIWVWLSWWLGGGGDIACHRSWNLLDWSSERDLQMSGIQFTVATTNRKVWKLPGSEGPQQHEPRGFGSIKCFLLPGREMVSQSLSLPVRVYHGHTHTHTLHTPLFSETHFSEGCVLDSEVLLTCTEPVKSGECVHSVFLLIARDDLL